MQPKHRDTRLSHAEIVETALRIATEDGLAALSMRRLARELRVAPMSLYEHVRDKDELLYEIVDHILGELEPPDVADPVEGAKQLAHRFRDLLLKHRALLPLLSAPEAGGTSPRGTAGLRQGLDYARKAGLDPDAAAVAYATLTAFVVGHVITHTGALRPTTGAAAEQQRSRLEEGRVLGDAAGRWPDPDTSFAVGLDALVIGLASTFGGVTITS